MKRNLVWYPFLALFIRDMHRFYKVKIQTLVMPIITYSLYLVIFGISLGKLITINELSYLNFIIPGLVALGVINNSFQNGSSSVFIMKITGEIIDIKSTTLHFQQIIWAITLSSLIRGIFVGFLTIGVGQLFHYFYEGSWISIHHLSWLVTFMVLGGAIFSKIGLFVGLWSKSFDHISAIGGFIILPLIYLGGIFFDLDKLSPIWQKISLFNPVLYFVNGIRYGFLGQSDIPIIESFSIALLGLLAAHLLACYSVFKGSYHKTD